MTFLVFCGSLSIGLAAAAGEATETSPIRRVLNMLHDMDLKVQEHIKEHDEAFDKFMCYCRKTGAELDQSISASKEKLPQLQSNMEEAASMKEQLQSDLKEHKASKAAAESAIAEQAQLRGNERSKFEAAVLETKTNIKNIGQALQVLDRARGGDGQALLQTRALDSVRNLVQRLNSDRLRSNDREQLVTLLEQLDRTDAGDGESGEAAEGTQDVSEILGILGQMRDDMQADLEETTKTDAQSQAEGEALVKAKQREVQTVQATIEEKHKRLSDTSVEFAQLQNDLRSTRKGLQSDSTLKADLDDQCSNKRKEFEEIKVELSNENRAILDATKILSADASRDVFSKTKVGVSFLQLAAGGGEEPAADARVAQAASALQALADGRGAKDEFSMLAHRAAAAAKTKRRRRHGGHKPAGKANFDKITGLVVKMVAVLDKEQEDDDLKQQMCKGELEREEQRDKGLGEAIEAKGAEVENAEDRRGQISKDLEGLRQGIAELDEAVKEATQQRKDGNRVFLKTLGDLNEALDLLHLARGRLEKFYGALLQEQTADKQGDQQQLADGSGSDDVALLGTDAAADQQEKVSAPPQKLQQEGNGVLGLLAQLAGELQKEVTEEKKDEAKDQADYERFLKVSAEKRETDAKTVSVRAAALAEVSENHRVLSRKRKVLRGEQEQTKQVIANLHKECDWLLAHYAERKTKRAGEVEALHRTKAVLKGARPALVQAHRHLA